MKKLLLILTGFLLPFAASAQNKIATRPIGQTAVSFSATPTFDASKTNTFKIVLTANVTSSTITGMEAGQELTFEVCQDGTGGRTFAWPGITVGPIAVLSGANVCTVETFHYDGTSATIWTTTTAGGGGSGTVTSGTGKCFTWYATTGTTVSNDCNLDDGLTNASALTYAGSNGIFAPSFNTTSSGAAVFGGTESTPSGAAVGKDLLSCGDVVSHACVISNNGDNFRGAMTWVSSSPVPGGVVVADPQYPRTQAMPRGTFGQPFIEGTVPGNPGFGQLDLSLSTSVVNILPKLNHPTSTVFKDQVNAFTAAGTLDLSASTVASAFRLPNGAGCTVIINGASCYDTTNNNIHDAVNGADHIRVVWAGTLPANNDCVEGSVVSSHIELKTAGTGACGSGGAPALSSVTAAVATWTTDNGDNPLIIRHAPTTSGRVNVRFSETVAGISGGTPIGWQFDTLAGSTSHPVQICAQGTTNCWRYDLNSLFRPLGTAAMAFPGSAKALVISQGPSAASTSLTGTVNQLVSFDGSGNPIAADPIISYNYVNIWTAQDVTVTRTSAAVRNPIFSQSGTLQLTWASITGSPATCTLQIQGVDSVGNALNNGSTFSVSPANGTTSTPFTAASTLQSAAQIKAIFACVTYPSAGTLTLDFTPTPNVNVTNSVQLAALPAGSAIVGKIGIDQTTPGTTNAISATNLPTTVDTNSGNKSASTLRVVLATDQPALTNKLLVTPDALPANQSVNVNQVAGTATDTNSGTKSAGTLRVVLATDQPALTNKLLVTPDSVALPANQSVNMNQKAGTALVADPCEVNAKVYFSQQFTANTQIITGTSAKKIYFCSFSILTGAATNIAVVEGTGTVCATGIATFPGLSGGTTAATGWNFGANGGLTYGNGGSSLAGETTNADNVCVLVSAANQTNVSGSYVVQ